MGRKKQFISTENSNQKLNVFSLNDSFIQKMHPLLAESFNKIYFKHHSQEYSLQDVNINGVPDIIIVGVTERLLPALISLNFPKE